MFCGTLSEKIIDVLRNFSNIDFGNSLGSLSVYTNEEVLTPLNMALNVISLGRLEFSDEELKYFQEKVVSIIPKVKSIISKLRDVSCRESLTHGNLTLENLLWDNKNKKILLIDPYAETYCESLVGDVSQLLQSSQSGYEYISSLLSGKQFSILKQPHYCLPAPLKNFTEIFTKSIQNESWFSNEHLLLFRASQFTRMFPFKLATEPRLGVMFMLHGISLLAKIKC